jgi:diguanylate cyclase (GGDEF)-like protein/PAS domain S-box-containing protein
VIGGSGADRAGVAPEQLEALSRLPGDVVSVVGADGAPIWVSDSVESVLGYSRADYLAKADLDLIHPDDQDELRRQWPRLLRAPGNEIRLEARLRAADGSWRWVEVLVVNRFDDDAVRGLVATYRDVQERRVAEEALIASEERFRALLAASAEVVAVTDATGTVTYCSPNSNRVFGIVSSEVVGQRPIELVHPDDLDRFVTELGPVFDGVTAQAVSTARLRVASGAYRWAEVTARDLLGDPHVHGVVCNARDVDDRVRAEQAHTESEARFRAMVQESSDVVLLADAAGFVTWASPAIEHVLGLIPDQVVGQDGAGLVHDDDVGRLVTAFTPVFAERGASAIAEARIQHAGGEWRWMEMAATNLLDDDRVAGVVLHLRDVTERRLATDALAVSEARFRAIAQASPIGIVQHDAQWRCIYVNDRWQEIAGIGFADALGDGWRRAIHPDDADRLRIEQPPPVEGDEAGEFRLRLVRPAGEVRWVSTRIGAMRDGDGEVVSWVGAVEDITERVHAQRDTERLTDIFEATDDVVGIVDRQGRVLSLNRAARQFFGLPTRGELALEVGGLLEPELVERLAREILPRLEFDGTWSGEVPVRRHDGAVVPMLVQLLVHTDEQGQFEFFSGVLHDISERKGFESRLAHQATHDPLTGLPNRTLLLERLEEAVQRAARRQSRVAVLFLDLDHFKVVNDSLGHGLGDRLLVAMAERLRDALRPGDTVARFGGDEFVVLCEDLMHREDATAIARRVTDAVSGAFTIGDREVFVGVSIGIAFAEQGGVEPATLISDADAAMYQAKAKGRARWEVFDSAMRKSAVDRLDIENSLRRAIDRRELRVHYQPIIALDSGTIRGVEALLRWEHPERGLLGPGEFITVAEETGLIVPIGAWVLDAACRQVQRWQAMIPGAAHLSVAVNLSGRQLSHPSLVAEVAAVLEETGIDPYRLELEITESVLMDDVAASEDTLVALRSLGVRLGIDDFGTGYSSMSYLRRFPVDVLKVDRSFVDGLGSDPSDSAIVAAIVTLAHTLGLRAVAEGVETDEHLAELRRLGCDFAQGFLMARPCSGDDLASLLSATPRW